MVQGPGMAWPDWVIRAYLKKLLRPIRKRLESTPFARVGEPVRLALVSSCGVHLRDDRPFDVSRQGDPSFRRIPWDAPGEDLTVTHGHYDESGVRADHELAFPVSAVRDLVESGDLAGLHPTLWSFRGFFTDVTGFLDEHVPQVVGDLQQGHVSAALLTPC